MRRFVELTGFALLACALTTTAAGQETPKEKPSQLARPNGNTPVDPKQSGDSPGSDAPAAATVPGVPVAANGNATGPPPQDWAKPLLRFAGSFAVRQDGGPPVTYENDCQPSGKRFVTCELLEGGETAALMVFVPGDDPGHLFTQRILPSGNAMGRGELRIDGDRWTFSSEQTRADGSMDYSRLTLVFSGAADGGDATFERERSDDGSHWMRNGSGTEKRQK